MRVLLLLFLVASLLLLLLPSCDAQSSTRGSFKLSEEDILKVANHKLVRSSWKEREIAEWTIEDVQLFLEHLGLQEYIVIFEKRRINGKKLLLMMENEQERTMYLEQDLGMKWKLDRELFIKEIEQQIHHSTTTDSTTTSIISTTITPPPSSTDASNVLLPLSDSFYLIPRINFWQEYNNRAKRTKIQTLLNGIIGLPRLTIIYLYLYDYSTLVQFTQHPILKPPTQQQEFSEEYEQGILFWLFLLFFPNLLVIYYLLPYFHTNFFVSLIVCMIQVHGLFREAGKFKEGIVKRNSTYLEYLFWQILYHSMVISLNTLFPYFLQKIYLYTICCYWLYRISENVFYFILLMLNLTQ